MRGRGEWQGEGTKLDMRHALCAVHTLSDSLSGHVTRTKSQVSSAHVWDCPATLRSKGRPDHDVASCCLARSIASEETKAWQTLCQVEQLGLALCETLASHTAAAGFMYGACR